MNDMKIKIFNVTANLERTCASAAKMSTTEGTCTDVYEGSADIEEARKSLSRIIRLGHTSVLEHGYFNIMFQDVSIFFEQFLIEHRLSAYTIKSGRYVNFEKAGYFEPKLRFYSEVAKDIKDKAQKNYQKFMKNSFANYKKLVDLGIKVEDARFLLPYSIKTNIYSSMNARELLHLISALIYGRGKNYPELVEIGNRLKNQLLEIAPSIGENLEKIETGIENKEEQLNQLLGNPSFDKDEDKKEKPLIEILDITNDIETTIATSAIIKNKQCSLVEAKKILEKAPDLTNKIIDIVLNDKRPRELEHINITFRMNDMPLILLKHQTRHRIQNINIPSFTEMINTNRYTYPPSIIAGGKECIDILESSYKEASKIYDEFNELGVYKEDLAYLFLHGKNVDLITSMNARNFYHLCKLRTCNRAQWKMRDYYRELLNQLIAISPEVFKKFGPTCYSKGYCPEGKLTCGQIDYVKEDFAWTVKSIEERLAKEKL